MVCSVTLAFRKEPAAPFLQRGFPTRAWDFPLSRAEKIQRLLVLYESETKSSTNAIENCERHLGDLQQENNTLRLATCRPGKSSEVGSSGASSTESAVDTSTRDDRQQQNCVKKLDSGANHGLLHASLRGTASLLEMANKSGKDTGLHAVQELQHTNAAVTCLCFGQERHHLTYILLAVAAQDGSVSLYRCYRTETEMSMLSHEDFGSESQRPLTAAANRPYIEVHSQMAGHTRPVTAAFFNKFEDQLVTASQDKSIRFWAVNSGELLCVLVAGSPVTAAAFLPLSPHVLVAATAGALLRLLDVRRGNELQSVRLGSAARVLEFDSCGRCLLVGVGLGEVSVLETPPRLHAAYGLESRFTVALARAEVTSLKFVAPPRCSGSNGLHGARVLVGAADSSVGIAACLYNTVGLLQGLTLQTRTEIATSHCRVSCCYSPSCGGYALSCGSAHGDMHVWPFTTTADDPGSDCKLQVLSHDKITDHATTTDSDAGGRSVVAVAVNTLDSVLATASTSGHIVFWRRLDFSHIAMAADASPTSGGTIANSSENVQQSSSVKCATQTEAEQSLVSKRSRLGGA